MTLTREQIALRLLCAMVKPGEGWIDFGENEIRMVFKFAEIFERVSHEVGGRPQRVTVRTGMKDWLDDDD